MQSDEQLNELISEYQFLRSVVESIQQRIGLIDGAITELQIANSTLEGLSEEEKKNSMLVPIGGGSYIRARLDDFEKLIVGIGADVAVEKTFIDARETYRIRILEFEKVRTSLQQQLEESSSRLSSVQEVLQKFTQQTRGEAENVRGP